MREIKFRAWDKDKKKIRKVTAVNWYDECVWVDETPNSGDRLLMENIFLMQFTGLKDKKGVKIFEGDIVKFGNVRKPYEIWFERGFFQTRDSKGQTGYHGIWNFDEDMEVIGNIYDNPELLKEE